VPDPSAVRGMFTRIAGRYDLLNRLLSAGIDRRWRQRVVGLVRTDGGGTLVGARIVDACCGTGDLSLAFLDEGAHAVGVDFTAAMVRIAGEKGAGRCGLIFACGDAQALPLKGGGADAATIAFGLRNVSDRRLCLAELARTVRPGGRVHVLEFSMPPGAILGALYRFYFTRVLPLVGGLVSGDKGAYRYLPETVLAWPSPETLALEMGAIGLVDCGFERLSGGIACLHSGSVPGHG